MEYWITDDGSSIYCDGDAGVDVPNHEMVVKHRCIGLAVAQLSECDNEYVQRLVSRIEEFVEDECVDSIAIRAAILDEADAMFQDMRDDEREEHAMLYDDPFEWMRATAGISNRWEWQCAWGEHIDERAFAMRNWGWIRVAHSCVEMDELTKNYLRRLASGLYDAFGESVEGMKFTIEAGDKYHTNVPFAAIEAADMSFFRQLRAAS